ncbi:MAG: DNA methyltransferase [Phycisphaerae bacterium]
MSIQLTPAQFVAKWSKVRLPERAASQEHFIDLCRMLGQPTPAEHDATGAEYTFEKGVPVTGPASKGSRGERGFADVWWKGKFAWEYKRKGKKHADLIEAYRQLCQYREALENPPLLIVSDINHTEIHTNFTGTAKQLHVVELPELDTPESLALLRRVFTAPDSFKPTITAEAVTQEVAQQIGTLAQALRDRDHDPHTTAHFLMKCMFCLFAEDVELLPPNLFERLLKSRKSSPERLATALTGLFAQMNTGGSFGVDDISHFNGSLFDDAPALELTEDEIDVLLTAARQDWGSVEPAVFGTLFERSLDPNTRAQIGAHYTSREDIMLVVEPVVMAPLRSEWDEVRAEVENQIQRRARVKTEQTQKKIDKQIHKLLRDFVERLASVRVLDPACGSGNFLYLAIQQLLDLEKQVITYAARQEISVGLFPLVRPTQLHGIEINTYAAELAQVVIWIGYLQWMRDNGYIQGIRKPILEPLQSIECRDAILDRSDPDNPKPADWQDADFIIGNPPFLGSKLFRQQGLEDDYIDAMFKAFDLPNTSDLCCYWFELARRAIEHDSDVRAGLLGTQGIRGGSNRTVLERIKETGDIFMAWSDRKWILDGAAVHVSIIGIDSGEQAQRRLDGKFVEHINPNLTHGAYTSSAQIIAKNKSIAFMGDTKVGPFDVNIEAALRFLRSPNPNGRPNAEVVRPWVNGLDLTRRWRAMWIVDFPPGTALDEASSFEQPFEYIRDNVRPMRKTARSGDATGVPWWIHQRPRPHMRKQIEVLKRYVATPNLTKFRLFVLLDSRVLPDHQLIAFARSDDYFFGVLHSSIHELWARRMGTQLREAESGFRYTPTTCFETFPLPWPPGSEPTKHEAHQRISEVAKELNAQRERWLNPPEWIEPIAQVVDAEDDFADVAQEARALIRQSAIMARAAKDKNLKKRTLTNLYNQRPTWLKLAHEKLDRGVLAAYALVDREGGWSEDWAEVWIDTGAGQPLPDDHDLAERRREVDQRVLTNLLRMNAARAGCE